MSAVVIEIADAVTAALNAASLSQSFTAERAYVPVHDLKTLTDTGDIYITVVPTGITTKPLDRTPSHYFDYVIDVAVQKSIGTGPKTNVQINAATDPLMLLTEEVLDLFRGRTLTGYTSAVCIDSGNRPVFSHEHLDDMRVYTSLVMLTFRVRR